MNNDNNEKNTKAYLNESHRFKRGNPGRPAGSKNKATQSIKQLFLDVFEEAGGKESFVAWMKKSDRNRALFYGWMHKMLPSNIVEDIKHEFEPLTVIINEDGDEPVEIPEPKDDWDDSLTGK